MIDLGFISKRQLRILIGVGCVCLVLILIFVYMPMLNKYNKLRQNIKQVETDINVANGLIQKHGRMDEERNFIKEQDLVLVINEITSLGSKNNIEFLSINPKDSQAVELMSFGKIPIEITISSDYENLGKFIESLRNIEKSMLSINNVYIERDKNIYPLIETTMSIEVYFKNG